MRKKFFLLLTALCLLAQCALFPALAQGARDPLFQAAFESNKLELREAQWYDNLSGYKLRIPAAMYEEVKKSLPEGGTVEFSDDGKWVIATLTAEISHLAEVYFFSPDGTKAIGMDDAYLYVVEDKTITLIQPNYERSVPDTYGGFAQFAQMRPLNWVGSEGITWSPDGRYAVITNHKQVLMYMRFIYGLYIIDTQSGELYCADTYPSDFLKGGASVLQACFDASGRYLYYTLYGGAYEDTRASLMRYDMQTGEKQRILPCFHNAAYPKLQRDSKGRLIHMMDTIRADESLGLSVYTQQSGIWTYRTYTFSMPSAVIRPTYMEVGSADIGIMLHTLLPNYDQNRVFSAFGRFIADDSFTGYDELLLIEDEDAAQATVLPLSDYQDGRALAEKITQIDSMQYLNAKLSPDGHYALLLMKTTKESTFCFLVMDMETLALRPVHTPAGTASLLGANTSQLYPSGYNWFAGNKIIIMTENGLKQFEFAF